MSMRNVMIPRAALAGALSLALAGCGGAGETATTAPAETAASPWPDVSWPLADDPALEKRIDELLATMTVEEKVGQLVQGDIASITPEDVRKYRLGSVLAGGNSDPGGKYDATPAQWLAQADAFY
ncbi:MAG: 1,4-beta-D-glucan glucohydrolase, partial [Comamonadaceae bacterium]